MSNTADRILGSIFYRDSADKDAASKNALRVKSFEGVFEDPMDRKIWSTVEEFLLTNSRAPSYALLKTKFEAAGEEALLERLKDVEHLEMFPPEDFFQLLDIRMEEKSRDQFDNLLAVASQINSDGFLDEEKKETLKGSREACKYVITNAADMMYRDRQGLKLRGDVRDETVEEMQRYLKAEQDPGNQVGILTGLDCIDQKTKGIKKGEMWILAGFSSHGKTTLALNVLHSAITRGYNVFYMSMEMGRDQIKEIIYSIHSGHSKFEGIHPPLRLDDIRYGNLTPEGKKFYFDHVLKDFRDNPEYGRYYVMQPNSAVTPKILQAEAELVHHQEFDVDLIVPDYAGLMAPDHYFRDWRAGLNSILKNLKQMCLSFSGGDKVAILTPFQINRDGMREAAGNNGVYKDLKCLSDANEADRSSDVVLAIYADEDMKLRNEAVLTQLKGRDTGCAEPTMLHANFAARIIKDVGEAVTNTEEALMEELDSLAMEVDV